MRVQEVKHLLAPQELADGSNAKMRILASSARLD